LSDCDHELLSALEPQARAALDSQVSAFIALEMPAATAAALRTAADLFEDQSASLPSGEALAGRLFAAALRIRAAELASGARPAG